MCMCVCMCEYIYIYIYMLVCVCVPPPPPGRRGISATMYEFAPLRTNLHDFRSWGSGARTPW